MPAVWGSRGARAPPRNPAYLRSEARGSETQDGNGVSLPGPCVVSQVGPDAVCLGAGLVTGA